MKLLCEEVCCLTCDRKSTLFTKVDLHVSCFTGSMISSSFLTWILVVSMMRIGELHFWRNHCFIFLILFFLQFHHIIYFDISSRVFWCRCCQFSVDLSHARFWINLRFFVLGWGRDCLHLVVLFDSIAGFIFIEENIFSVCALARLLIYIFRDP